MPNQLARIISGSIQEFRGTEAAALAMTTTNFANRAMPAVRLASGAVQGIAQIAGATAYNTGAHFNAATARTGNPGIGAGAAIVGPMAHLGKAVAGNVSAHFSHIANKLAGGPGSDKPISSVAERLYKSAKDIPSNPKAEK